MWDLLLDFLFESLKIFGLIIGLSFLISFLQTYIPFKKFFDKAFKKNNILGFLCAIGLGFLSPFCSCTIIPVIIIFIQTGVPLAITLTFFTSAALLNITSILALFTVMPPYFVLLYMGLAVLLCTIIYLSFLKQKNYKREKAAVPAADSVECINSHRHCHNCSQNEEADKASLSGSLPAKESKHKRPDLEIEQCKSFKSKLQFAAKQTLEILSDIWIYLLIALIVSFALTEFFTAEVLTSVLSKNLVLTNVVLSIFGGVMHGEIIALIPVLQLFIASNLPYATIIAFLGTAAAVSIPLSITLSKLIKIKKIVIYNLIIVAFYLSVSMIFMLF